MPPLVSQTAASARLHLYGDAARAEYVDRNPRDGIDDARARTLHRIAVRFAPILRRNNFSRPRFFARVLDDRPVLHLDTWYRGRLVATDSIILSEAVTLDAQDGGPEEPYRSDSLLLALLRLHDPRRGQPRTVPAEGDSAVVAFFDFPGEDQRTWRAAYRGAEDEGLYAHFFVHEDRASAADRRYTLVVQYWLFYPFNDSGNNHEGDWEHIAVHLTTRERAAARDAALGEPELQRILDGRTVTDSLVIAKVEYYFHESVVVLPYQAEPAPPSTRLQELLHLHVWEQSDYMEDVVRQRMSHLGGRFASHPIGYIGGNNKGPDELTHLWPRFLGSYNRNSHGTYPFSGTWQGVGPLGATEQLAGAAVPRLHPGADPSDAAVPLEALFADDHFMAFDSSEIALLPDWERVAELVLLWPDARREWSWLLLPVRWGFPASASPGGGAIAHVDVGQVAPEGPAFQSTWNRIAEESGFHVYRPRVLRALFSPMTPWDRLSSGWGFLNIPKTLLGFVPGWSVLLAQLGPWLTTPLEALGAAPPKVFAPERPERRLSSMGIGVHRQFGGRAFAQLLPQPGEPSFGDAFRGVSPSFVQVASLGRHDATGLRAWLSLHYGERFTVQNTLTHSTSRLAYSLLGADAQDLGRIEGKLDMTEITGGFRYKLMSTFGDAAQLSAGAGWGWTWYDLHAVRSTQGAFDYERRAGYGVTLLPSARWWPNTWYASASLELLAPRRGWLADRIGYGVLFEYTGLVHRLGDTSPGRGGSLGGVTRRELAAGLVVSW
jgi:hypothetical protein